MTRSAAIATRKPAKRSHAEDLRAASRLVIDATTGITSVVEQMHLTIGSGPRVLGSPLRGPVKAVTGLLYGGVRGVTRAVGKTIDLALRGLAPLLGESAPGPERLAVQAALNGVLGDQLEATGNPLALPMALCREGEPLELTPGALREALEAPSSHLVVLVHGSSMNDLQWERGGHHHGRALERDLGCTWLALRYNTGRHVSANGAGLAAVLEALLLAYPAEVRRLTLLAHSMGGLVARAACHAAEGAGHRWRSRLTELVFLGTPHHGAPLEKGGNLLDTALGLSRYSAPLAALGKIRSAGVTDLRFGTVLEADWQGRDRFQLGRDRRTPLPLPGGVRCFAVAASLSKAGVRRPRGDGLVPVASALGQGTAPGQRLELPEYHRRVVYEAGHLDLLDRREVYDAVRGWLEEPLTASPRASTASPGSPALRGAAGRGPPGPRRAGRPPPRAR